MHQPAASPACHSAVHHSLSRGRGRLQGALLNALPSLHACFWPPPCSVYDSQKMQARGRELPVLWRVCCPTRPRRMRHAAAAGRARAGLRGPRAHLCSERRPPQAFTSSLFLAGLFSSLFAAKITQTWGRKASPVPPACRCSA